MLSPYLLNLYTETIFRHFEDSKGVSIGGTQINNLRYADDTVLLADSGGNLQNMMNKVNEVGKLHNMKLNAKKTKALVISRNENKPKVNFKVDGTAVEQVGSCNYLGQTVSDHGRCVDEIKKRIGIAKTTFLKMKDVLKSTKVPLNTRKRILQCYAWSTLLYGGETWTITKVMKTRIQAFELRAYRMMLKISWTEKVTNKEAILRMKMKKRLFTIIQIRKLKYFGHSNRHSSMQTTLLNGKANGKRRRGRPRTSWTSNIKEWTGKSYIEAVRLTINRDDFRIIALNPLQEYET